MSFSKSTILKVFGRNLAVLLLITVSVAAFATLGDGKRKSDLPKSSLLSSKTTKPGTFSLRSGYTYRGTQIINSQSQKKHISLNLNNTITYQKGNTTYIVPLKKKVVLSKVKIELGNRQFQRN
jgi:hypothetical protein